jgi:hypothetical protein
VLLCVLAQPRVDDSSAEFNAVLCKTCSVLLCVLKQPRVDDSSAEYNAVLCKTCSVLLCVLKQPRVDDSSSVPNKREAQFGAIGPIYLRQALDIGRISENNSAMYCHVNK